MKGLDRKVQLSQKICPAFKKCGACQLQQLAYDKQLLAKQKALEELLGKFGKVEPIIGMEDPYYYRNKVHEVRHRRKNGDFSTRVFLISF